MFKPIFANVNINRIEQLEGNSNAGIVDKSGQENTQVYGSIPAPEVSNNFLLTTKRYRLFNIYMSKDYSSYPRRSAVVNETFDKREVWHSIPGNGHNFLKFLLPICSFE